MTTPGFAKELCQRAEALIRQHYVPKLARIARAAAPGFPLVTSAGRWVDNPIERWSDGFWPGLFWLAWQATGEGAFRETAARQSAVLAPRIERPDANYDLGFLFHSSAALGHRLTGEPRYREIALRAARRLCDFFSEPAGLITITYPERIARFGRPRVTTKIDVMMNLTLLWWAYAETGEGRFREVAQSHALRSLAELLRDDGSVWELADFDPESGALLLCDTKEGVEGRSCWARAQAWAVYGFLLAARATGESRFHDAARRAYAFWHSHLPGDGLPYWDLLAPPRYRDARDSSAAAIVLAALVRARQWNLPLIESEEEIVAALSALAASLAAPGEDGVLARGCAYYRKGEGVDGASVWGDYYLLEALCGLAGTGPAAVGAPCIVSRA